MNDPFDLEQYRTQPATGGGDTRQEVGGHRVAFVVCGILRDEIEAAVQQHQIDAPVFYLAPAPCIDYSRLEVQLTRQLERASALAEKTVVVIGRCHPEIDEIVARHSAKRLEINDCFDALLGKRRKPLDRDANTFFTTPTWLKHWQRAFREEMNWDQVDVRQNFGHYDRILLVDAGVTPVSDEEILAFFDYTQTPVEPLPVDLDNLAELLLEELPH